MNNNYNRVIPRDLFNESNLLFLLGKLSLMIHDGEITNIKIHHDDEHNLGFNVCQNDSDGSLYISNLHIIHKGKTVEYFRPLNTKEKFSLYFIIDDNEYEVFDDNGNYIFDT